MSFESLYAEIEEYRERPAGWDFESDLKTSPICLNYLKQFCQLLPLNIVKPHLAIGTGEEVGVYFDLGEKYFIVNFFATKGGFASGFFTHGETLVRFDYIPATPEGFKEFLLPFVEKFQCNHCK